MQEVASRDGFQNEPSFVPTTAKIAFVDALGGCGFAKIEVTSFTSPRAIPALSDAEAQQLARTIDSAPAGASDLVGVLVFIFVLLLVTDILGLTKVFPFTRSVR